MASSAEEDSPRSPDGSGKDEFEDAVDDPEVAQAVNELVAAVEKHHIRAEATDTKQAHPSVEINTTAEVSTGEATPNGNAEIAKPENGSARLPEKNGDQGDNQNNKEEPAAESEGEASGGEDEGDEDQEKEEPDEDEVKENPAYIPRHGKFYMHDQRAVTEQDSEEAIQEQRSRADRKWEHDKFDERYQKPKSATELIKRYGFDIRKGASPDDAQPPEKGQRGADDDDEEESRSPPPPRRQAAPRPQATRGQASGERPPRQRTDEPRQERRSYEKDSRGPTGPPRGPPRHDEQRGGQGYGAGYKRTFVPSRNAAEQQNRPNRPPQGAPYSQPPGPRNAARASENRAPRDDGRYQHRDEEYPPLDSRNNGGGQGQGKRYTSQRTTGSGRDYESNDVRNDRPRNDKGYNEGGPPPRQYNRNGPPSGGPPSTKYPPPRAGGGGPQSDRGPRQGYENAPQYAPQHNRSGPGGQNGRGAQQYPHPRQPTDPVYFDPQQQPNVGRAPAAPRERRRLEIAPPAQ